MTIDSGDTQPARRAGSKLLRAIGWLVVLASLVFLAQRIVASRVWTLEGIAIGAAALITIGGAIAYGMICLLLSIAWCAWLRWAGESQATLNRCHGIYGRTQIAKYLPGNVFHFAGRHVVGRRAGFAHKPMVAAAVMELLALVSAATVLAVAGLGWFGVVEAARQINPWLMGAAVVAVVMLPLVAALVARRLPGSLRIETGAPAKPIALLRRLLMPYGCTILFMAAAGGLLLAIVRFGIPAAASAPATLVIGCFAFAWLVGFIVPGASGGLGVREAAIVLVLSPQLGDGPAVIAALLMRLVTLGGDLVFFALSHAFRIDGDQ